MPQFLKRIPSVILLFFAIDLALVLLYLINWRLQLPFPQITQLLNLDEEANLPAWYSSMQLLLVAGSLAIFAFNRFDRKNRQSWALIGWPLIFVLLSLDETAGIHERLGLASDVLLPGGSRTNTRLGYTGIWMFLLGAPFLIMMLILLASLKKYLRGQAGVIKKLSLGLMIFVGAACGVEIFSNFVPHAGKFYVLEVCIEELGEMAGETFFIWAGYELLQSCRFSLRFSGNEPAFDQEPQQTFYVSH